MKIIAITQARLGSTRLPKKIFKKCLGKTFFEIHIDRVKKSKLIDEIIVATTDLDQDFPIVELAKKLNVNYFQGSESDVLDRFYCASQKYKPDYIVRLTSDCPLIDPLLIDKIVNLAIISKVDYVSNTLSEDFPDGQDIEVFNYKSLELAWKNSNLKSEREHVTPFIRKNSTYNGKNMFSSIDYKSPKNYNMVRMTLDEIEDYHTLVNLIKFNGLNKSWIEYTEYMIKNTGIVKNNFILRNEGYNKSVENE
tara:strand:+ start:2146 stop:2898 length:753 start_codon:yes stop_codon:yes gene_type:complete